jgi:predicted MFS family arabinose efflux permease
MTEASRAPRHPIETVRQVAEDAVGGPARLQIIFVLACILALDTADKATVSAVAGSLKDAFGIGNTDIGVLIAATSFAGAGLTIPIGILVDRFNRRRILLFAIALWTAAMVVSGTATSFIYLLIVRIGLGGVTAAAAPTVASLTGDYFPGRDRASVYGMILAGELVGTGVGFFLSGEIASWVDWRWSFYLMGIPSLLVLFIVWIWLPEPARGGQSAFDIGEVEVPDREAVKDDPERRRRAPEQSAESETAQRQMRRAGIRPRRELILNEDPTERSIWWVMRYLLRIPTYDLLIAASALGYYFFAGVRGFAMIYLTQRYGIGRSTLSALIIPIGIGALAGVLLSGRLTRRMLGRGYIRSRILVPGIALFVSVLFFAPALWTTSVWIGTALLTAAAAFLAAANPPIEAARLDIVIPRMWGRGEAGRMAVRALLEGGAPILFGAVSGWLGGGETGLGYTFLLMLIPLLVASVLAIPAYFTYSPDVATAAASVRRIQANRDRR